jgi:hypothetical protein
MRISVTVTVQGFSGALVPGSSRRPAAVGA